MLKTAFWVRLACVLVVMGWAASGSAAVQKYSLSGNGGYWIGGGMPIPTTTGAPPNNAMQATANATVQMTTTATGASNPHQMTICPWKLRKPFPPGGAVGQWGNNPNLFMVSTQLSLKFPASPAVGVNVPNADGNVVFRKSGRTGPPIYTWCPNGNTGGACTPAQTSKGVAGLLTYKRTLHQFGGPGQGEIHGKATVWARVGSPPPCKHTALAGANPGCIAVKGYASPAPLVGVGAPFGYFYSTSPPQAAPNIYIVNAPVPTGTIATKVPVGTTPFINAAKGFGGPWTTGQVTVVQTAATPSEIFTLTGSDGRAPSGGGNISLVAGGLSNRLASGPNANRGWLFLNVGAAVVPVPSISRLGIASLGLVLLGIGAAGLALVRHRK